MRQQQKLCPGIIACHAEDLASPVPLRRIADPLLFGGRARRRTGSCADAARIARGRLFTQVLDPARLSRKLTARPLIQTLVGWALCPKASSKMPRALGDLNWSGYDLVLYCPSENGPHKAISKKLYFKQCYGRSGMRQIAGSRSDTRSAAVIWEVMMIIFSLLNSNQIRSVPPCGVASVFVPFRASQLLDFNTGPS